MVQLLTKNLLKSPITIARSPYFLHGKYIYRANPYGFQNDKNTQVNKKHLSQK